MSLERRLRRLENFSGGCPECSLSPDAPEAWEVAWDDSEEGRLRGEGE